MNCPKCNSYSYNKDGYSKGDQRYKCKNCQHRFTEKAKPHLPPHYRRVAIILFLEGYTLKEIAKHMGVYSHNTIANWLDDTGIKDGLVKLRKPKVDLREDNYLVAKKMDYWLTIAWDNVEDASVVEKEAIPRKYKPWGIKLGHKRPNTYIDRQKKKGI